MSKIVYAPAFPAFGSHIPHCEPAWYQGFRSPYYRASHAAFRATVRAFVEQEIKPNIDEWVASPTGYPRALHEKAYAAGIQGVLYPTEWGGTRPADFDAFHELVLWDELARMGGGGVLGQMSINSMALPPVMQHGSQRLRDLVCRDVVTGKKNICLAISEPGAGSDVARIACTAALSADGTHFVLNGQKKWITGGTFADFFTIAVRTGGEGMGGISLLLMEAGSPGISIRKMATQFDNSHSTTFIELDDVKVPFENLIGEQGKGFKYIVHNFNHERFVISAASCREARLCFEEAMAHALTRKTFGKRLIDHQLIRYKLAEMARGIEATQDMVERVAYQFASGVPHHELGAQCALLKVQVSKTFEHCAREASQIFGGSSIVREGKGKVVERLYRCVRASAIPGGSEEILLDLAIREAVRKSKL